MAERFWAKVARVLDTTTCWLWLASQSDRGYGRFDGMPAHQAAWLLATGTRPLPGQIIGHTCDTPACVRNDDMGTYVVNGVVYARRGHLFLTTHAGNAADRDAKQRHHTPTGEASGARRHPERIRRGEQHYKTRWTEADIVAMRHAYQAGTPPRALAARYHTSSGVISQIVRYRRWRHVP